MRCDELKELIPLHAIDLLDADEQAAVRGHLDAGCPRCAAEMAAITGTLDLLPLALPEEEPSPMAKARLMAAVRQEGSAAARPPARTPLQASSRWAAWGTAAAAALTGALIAATITSAVMMRRQDELMDQMASLRREVQEAKQTIQLVSSPFMKVANLLGQGEKSEQAARLFWDPERGSWQLYAANLPAAPAGRTYQLWVITDAGRKISAGTFDTRLEAAAAGRVTIPSDAGRPAAAGVTVEPVGGSEQPTTTPFLVGSI